MDFFFNRFFLKCGARRICSLSILYRQKKAKSPVRTAPFWLQYLLRSNSCDRGINSWASQSKKISILGAVINVLYMYAYFSFTLIHWYGFLNAFWEWATVLPETPRNATKPYPWLMPRDYSDCSRGIRDFSHGWTFAERFLKCRMQQWLS